MWFESNEKTKEFMFKMYLLKDVRPLQTKN